MKKDNKVNSITQALENISALSNMDVIIGKQITTPNGNTILPVSKITVGLMSGSGEYGKIKMFSPNKDYPNSMAGGGLVTIKPFGFLVEKGKTIKFIECKPDVFDKTFDTLSSYLENINEK